jgi:hypothetical protein
MRCLGKPFGMRASLRRQTIALVTAYAVALQALLPALTLVVGASGARPSNSVDLCISAVESDRGLPREHKNGCPHGLACLMTGCSGIAAALLPEHLEFGSDFARIAVRALRPVDGIASLAGLPHSARAPPHV